MQVKERKPAWLKKKTNWNSLSKVSALNNRLHLNTVCKDAMCPNRSECWERLVAAFMILGNICTRNCKFCNVASGKPEVIDSSEPVRLAQAVKELNLKHVVITSVSRDDLPDFGAAHFVSVIKAIRGSNKHSTVEVLTPDFNGEKTIIKLVVNEQPDIYNHNIETVARLTPHVRSKATYNVSLKVLRIVKEINPSILTKSGLLLGFGETEEEVFDALRDLRNVGCDLLTIGQYLPPSHGHFLLRRYISLEEFDRYKDFGFKIGFKYIASGPFVRSSYNADKIYELISNKQLQ